MAFTNTPFVDGQIISEADLKGRIDNFEKYVNGGSLASDLAHGEWVKSHHIYRPDFIGGSNRRGEFCTGTVYYRLHPPDNINAEVFHQETRGTGDSDSWQPVNGLNVTVKAHRPMKLLYTATWLAWEEGCNLSANVIAAPYYIAAGALNNPTYVVADFALFVQKLEQDASSLKRYYGTNRRLFASLSSQYDDINGKTSNKGKYKEYTKSAGKQMSTHQVIDLDVGVYTVGIRVKPQKETGSDDGARSQNIFVRPRSCVVDGHFTTDT